MNSSSSPAGHFGLRRLAPARPLPPGLSGELLRAGAFGLEREALRVTPGGKLALTPHPAEFGDKLANRRITVDFSESQLELITPPRPSVEEALTELAALHDEVEEVLDAHGERLWPFSMPPALPADADIPIAQFAGTPEGRSQELYRIGLGNRYGRKRQMISGVHFSFSFSPALLETLRVSAPGLDATQFREAAYFRIARNFLRNRWLVLYLTGASPTADASFDRVVGKHVDAVRACCPGCCDEITRYARDAISLRMSRHGYADTAFAGMPVSFNGSSGYIADLRRLLATRSDRFSRLGLMRGGAPVQINDHVLQRESEFYAAIRLKSLRGPGESLLDALTRTGVRYAEVRVLDIDPYAREGIHLATLRFLQVFLLDCLLGDASPLLAPEWKRAQENHHRIALFGRSPTLRLRSESGEEPIFAFGRLIFARLRALATRLDDGLPAQPFNEAVQLHWARFLEPAELPSSRLHQAMKRGTLTHAAYGAQLLAATANPLLANV